MLDQARAGGVSTIMVGYLLGISSELEARGVDAPDVLRSAGVFNELSNDPLNRFSSPLLSQVLALGAEATRDPYFGLNAARSMKASDLHVVGLGLLASGSMLSFCSRLVKFMPMIGGSGKTSLEEKATSFRLATRAFGPMCAHAQDSWLSLIYRLMCQVGSAQLKPLRVELMHSRPAGGTDAYAECFRAPIVFGQEACALEFAKADMLRPLRSGCEELASVQDVAALGYLARLDASDVVARIQVAIMDCLQQEGRVSLESVSGRIRLSARQIHQRLAESHTNYQTLLDQTRLFLAKERLKDSKLPITELAYMLGFTDSANFSRAFKRWTGRSPSSFRSRATPNRPAPKRFAH